MKIGIITRHSVPNYGSLLQTYATQKAIENLGYDTEIIDYTRYEERGNNLAETLLKGKKWDKNQLTRFIYKILQSKNYKTMYNRFVGYRKELLMQSKTKYGSIGELIENPPKADIFCSGSDQIWGKIGTVNYDETYFLDFVKEKKCISYGASFGTSKIDSEMDKNIKKLLEKYTSILVREDSAKQIIESKGIKNVQQVLDPTFLLDKEEWEKLTKKAKTTPKEKYILVYQLHANKEFNKYAKKIAKKKNLKLIRVGYSIYHIFRSGKLVLLPTPYEFLNYIKNAECVLTDSFHATALSIILNKNFIDILPNNNTQTRIESILKLFEIKDRILKDYNDYELIDKIINYDITNEKLLKEKENSQSLLIQALKS